MSSPTITVDGVGEEITVVLTDGRQLSAEVVHGSCI
jgi:hypothetical protein